MTNLIEKKTAIFIGRFQPFHEGHKNFSACSKKNKQVCILVMDLIIQIKNPLNLILFEIR